MKATFIGTGNVGATLARRFKEIGYEVLLYNRSATLPEGFDASELTTDLEQAVDVADIIVIALPFDAIAPIVQQVGNWEGKIVIDATNPIAKDLQSMSVGNTTSGAEKISEWLPTAHVVKTFNTTGWENMANPHYEVGRLTMFYAGDDQDSKQLVAEIIQAIGFHPYDAGKLFMARFLEPMAMVWIHPARLEGKGPDFGFSVIDRTKQK